MPTAGTLATRPAWFIIGRLAGAPRRRVPGSNTLDPTRIQCEHRTGHRDGHRSLRRADPHGRGAVRWGRSIALGDTSGHVGHGSRGHLVGTDGVAELAHTTWLATTLRLDSSLCPCRSSFGIGRLANHRLHPARIWWYQGHGYRGISQAHRHRAGIPRLSGCHCRRHRRSSVPCVCHRRRYPSPWISLGRVHAVIAGLCCRTFSLGWAPFRPHSAT